MKDTRLSCVVLGTVRENKPERVLRLESEGQEQATWGLDGLLKIWALFSSLWKSLNSLDLLGGKWIKLSLEINPSVQRVQGDKTKSMTQGWGQKRSKEQNTDGNGGGLWSLALAGLVETQLKQARELTCKSEAKHEDESRLGYSSLTYSRCRMSSGTGVIDTAFQWMELSAVVSPWQDPLCGQSISSAKHWLSLR